MKTVRKKMIGCNIPANTKPGGFTGSAYKGSASGTRRSSRAISMEKIKEAATVALNKRDMGQVPTSWESTVPPASNPL